MSTVSQHTEQNRRAWDEIALIRQQNMHWPAAAFFAQGGSVLDARVLACAGDVAGCRLLHLQCATGEETLSWAVAGAKAVGVDISAIQIEFARQKAVQAGLDVGFVAADIYNLPAELQDGSFEIVYTGGGALVWLPDIVTWAQVVAYALRRGGRLILFEEHPIAGCLGVDNGRVKVMWDYFGRGTPSYDQGWGHFAGGEEATTVKAEFSWPLGDVVTALVRAGMHIELLEEFPSEAEWRFGEALDSVCRLPGLYLLAARKH